MFSILPYSFVFGLYFLIFGVQNMYLVSSPTRTVFAGCTNKSKKQANNQTNKNKQYTFIAAVPAYCRLIASPLLAHISWKAVLIEEGRIWSGSCLPNFFSWVEKKYVHYKKLNRPTNGRTKKLTNNDRGTEGQRDGATSERVKRPDDERTDTWTDRQVTDGRTKGGEDRGSV